ncbi:Beta-glucosidase 31 [Linum perenne]
MIISSSTNMGLGIIVIMLLTSSLLCSSSAKLQANIDSDPCLESDYVYKPSPELPHGRFSFPQGFVFGTATSSYQIEGASNVHGKGPSVWDRFTHEFPDRIEGGGNGDVAIDHYNRFLEDIQRMKYMNVDAYRLSISWPRVIPSGRRSDGINREGIQFYHTLLDALIENEIDPYVTIWHWDTPQTIEAEYGGFLSRDIVKDYVDYCDLLFEEYGSKVTKWITLNEPMGNTGKAYDEGVFAPGRCSPWVNRACQAGDSGIEPYIVAHNLLLAHSGAYHLYKNKYKHLTAEIGITYVTHWFVPYSNETKDVDAAQRALDWISMQLGSYWQYLYPEGLRVLLEYTKETYMDPVIYITENGMSAKDNATQTLEEALKDETRIDFYNSHLTSVLTAMNEKQVKVKGYFAWSYADNFEWNEGYTVRFGLNYVNYTDLSRHPKHSACWFTNFCSKIQPKSFDLHHLFTTSSTSTSLGGRRSLSSSAGRFN